MKFYTRYQELFNICTTLLHTGPTCKTHAKGHTDLWNRQQHRDGGKRVEKEEGRRIK
jgi:hypothetical protein